MRMITLFPFSLIACVLLSQSRVNSQCSSDTLFLDSANGSLYSPNYPLPYPRGSRCRWLIVAPPNKVIALQFASFEMAAGDDSVVLRDGNSPSSPMIANLRSLYISSQRDLHNEIYQSSKNYLYIEFSSPSSFWMGGSQHVGFSATYSTSERQTTYSAYATIEADEIPRNLPLQSCDGNGSCTWIIKAPSNQTVRLRLSLRWSGYWCQRELTIYDGNDATAPMLYSFRSGDNNNNYDVITTRRSTQSYMYVSASATITTDYRDGCSARGLMFNAAYSAIPFNPSMLFNCYHDDGLSDSMYVRDSKSCSACQKTVVTKGSVYGVARTCVTPDQVCTPGRLPLSDNDRVSRGIEGGTVYCCYSDMCNRAEPVHSTAAVAVGFTLAMSTVVRLSGVLS